MKYIFLFFSITITGLLIYLIQTQLSSKIGDNWTDAIYVSFCINLFCLPIFSFLNKALNINKKIKRNYFTNLSDNSINILYKLLFVKYFKQIITFNRRNNEFRPNLIEALSLEINKMEESEISHTLPYLILVPCSILFLIYLKVKMSLLTLLFSIPLHLMPVILQRKNSGRIQKILQRLQKK